jgi:hypothetical protein
MMDFDDLIHEAEAPPNRRGKHDGAYEQHFREGAVMVAYAMHLLRTAGSSEVSIHPDGIHGQQFDFRVWLGRRGFSFVSSLGRTAYGGNYSDSAGNKIIVNPTPGLGDVVAKLSDGAISAECKGGIINSRHPGQVSRLDRGLCETIGRLMASPSSGRQVAVVPYTESTARLAKRLAPRCATAGIEIGEKSW